MSDLEKKYLVRIVLSGEVLGPFSQKELIQKIKKAELSGSDEVTGPFSFWRRLQDHPEFREVALNFKTRVNRIVTKVSDILSISKTPVSKTPISKTSSATSSNTKNTKTITDTINAKTMTDSKTPPLSPPISPPPTKTENTEKAGKPTKTRGGKGKKKGEIRGN